MFPEKHHACNQVRSATTHLLLSWRTNRHASLTNNLSCDSTTASVYAAQDFADLTESTEGVRGSVLQGIPYEAMR